MRQPELDAVLGAMLDTHPGISDLVFSVGRPLQVEAFGELKEAVISNPSIRKLTRYQTEQLALTIIGNQLTLAGQVFGGEIDQVRILTAAVPEPASAIAWSIILSIGCVCAIAKRRA